MLLSLVSQPKNSHQAIIDLEQLWIPVKIIIEVQYELIYFFNHFTVMKRLTIMWSMKPSIRHQTSSKSWKRSLRHVTAYHSTKLVSITPTIAEHKVQTKPINLPAEDKYLSHKEQQVSKDSTSHCSETWKESTDTQHLHSFPNEEHHSET